MITKKKHRTPDQIVTKLLKVERLTDERSNVEEAVLQVGVAEEI